VSAATSTRALGGGAPVRPVWRLLRTSSAGPIGDVVALCELPDSDSAWRGALAAASAPVPPGEALMVACERGTHGAILHFLAHRRWLRVHTPSIRRVVESLRNEGFDIEDTYSVWPSARRPRVVVPARSYRSLRSVQRSGVLGGGGTSLIGRSLASSVLAARLTYHLPPATAIVARKRIAQEVEA
jgi:hypothetical protein